MADDFRKVLTEDDDLVVTFVVEADIARVEFTSGSIDLTETDDVVAVLDGRGLTVESQSSNMAHATIGDWSAFEGQSPQLMVRVHEFFEGWELG